MALILGLPDTVSVGEALHIAGTAGRLQAFNFSTDPSVRFTFWTGTHRRAVPVPVVLRHRSEPGAALPDRQVGGRSAHLALHERLLEDSAAGAGDDHRRADVRVLPVHAAADAVQPRARRARARERAGPASTSRSSRSSRRRSPTGATPRSSWPMPSGATSAATRDRARAAFTASRADA